MSGFTEEEIATELKRRGDGIKRRDEDQREAQRQPELSQSDTVCLICGTPVKSYMVTEPENPLCDTCLGDDWLLLGDGNVDRFPIGNDHYR